MIKKGVLKEHSKIIDYCKRLLDLVIIFCSSWLAYIYKFGIKEDIYDRYWILILSGLLATFIIFNTLPLYRSWRGMSLLTEYRVTFLAWLTSCLLLMVISFILKISTYYSREWLITWFIVGLFLLLFYRFFLRIILRYYRKRGFNQKWICLIAYGDSGERVFLRTVNSPWLGYNFSAVFSNKQNKIYGDKYLGNISHSFNWLQNNDVDQVWIAIPLEKIKIIRRIVYEMRHKTTDIRFIPDLSSYNLINHSISEIMGMPYVNISISPMQDNINLIFKRIEDLILSSIILAIIFPILVIISIIIKLSSTGPVLYRQTRVGINNTTFTILKFRTMPVNIEKKTGPVWASQNDKRTTKFGSFLRKTSLDELPQLFNVIKGDMSLVGPRPERPELIDKFKNEIPLYMKKHMVKAGMTGWAQVNGWRGNTDLKKRIEYDIYYIENWSIWFDLKIILLTFIKGFINKNAY